MNNLIATIYLVMTWLVSPQEQNITLKINNSNSLLKENF